MASKIGLIAGREYNERVRKKSFIITTILTPLLFVGVIALMVWIMSRDSDKVREVIVVDRSGIVAPGLHDDGTLKFNFEADNTLSVEAVREQAPEDTFGVLVIGADIMTDPRDVSLYTWEPSTIEVEAAIAGQIQQVIETEKLHSYNIDNLDEILAQIETPITLQTKEFTATGEMRDSSSALSMVLAYIFGFLIYMFVIIYGSMVMQGVIEEKSNKVLEVMVSSVRPFDLMMGKILGIAGVALTQLAIWVVFIGIAGSAIAHMFAGAAMDSAAGIVAASGEAVPVEAMNFEQSAFLGKLTDLRYLLTMVIGFIIYFIGGYLLYASMFAAVGSAVENEKDTQNLQLPITVPLILALMVMFSAMRDPQGSIAFWFSMIPFTSPIVMLGRLPYGVPMWELATSVVLLYATFVGIVWLAGKIYRVGIFMYGKKPTLRELLKWSRYKY